MGKVKLGGDSAIHWGHQERGLNLYQRQLVELDRSGDRRAPEVRALSQTTIRYSWGTHRVPRFAIGTVSVHRSWGASRKSLVQPP